jgi:hypothetical protein
MMPMGGDNMPPIDPENGMNDEMPIDMSDETSNMNTTQDAGMPSDFDTNFDAGVEADEETDPKKYIQQLTGKLSQTLNTYNSENGEPDTELGKYVLGMLVKQGTKGMDEKDRKEIIKKINTNDSVESEEENSEMPEEDAIEPDNDVNMQNESVTIRCTKKQIFESFGIAMNDNENTSSNSNEIDTKISNKTVKNRSTLPFEAPKKFK